MGIQIILTCLSACLLALSFPPVHMYWIGCVALVPYFYCCHYLWNTSSLKHIIIQHSIFGLIFMGFTNFFVFQLIEFSSFIEIFILFIVYTLFETLFIIGFGLSVRYLSTSSWMIPCFWLVFEYLRSIGPFGTPNGVIGYSQAFNPLLSPYASLGGVFLVSFVLCCITMSIVCLIHVYLSTKKVSSYLSIVMFMGLLFSIPLLIPIQTVPSDDSLSVSVIQTQHSIAYKSQAKNRPTVRQDLLRLSKQAIQDQSPQLIVWPETITSSFNLRKSAFMNELRILSQEQKAAFIFGTPRYDSRRKIYNSAAFLHESSLSFYDKISLMPFGEYWPYKSWFKRFGLDNIIPGTEFTPGKKLSYFTLNQHKMGVAICLETTQSAHFRQCRLDGCDLLISLVNDAWFKKTSIRDRQLQMLVFRALETGLPIIQSANFGISGIIGSNGQMLAKDSSFQEAIVSQTLVLDKTIPPYLAIGDLVVYLSIAILFLCGLRKGKEYLIP
ncbi:apolipoprotein N-acyltransferase [Candidatus Marinamargulisbacteria bacterium SCGC AG-343-D04]|nr:apolipoprotein N-acyltransferase [Candidatus Marinamargulisbacteria bacterium SCGC AG-343-D04]